ncbi:MAG: hypothetical protein ACOZEN_10685 [Thermodesulfobacteriota bacterium]
MADISFDRPEQTSPLARFVSQYWRALAAGTVAALMAVAAYAWYNSSAQQAKLNAENDLGVIIAGKTGPERLTALEAYLKTAPSSVKSAVYLEIARTALAQGAYDKAADAWNQLSLSGPEGLKELAVIGHATALAQGGNLPKAVQLLADFMPKASKPFQPVVARQLAAVAEEAKAWKEAAAAYELMKNASSGGNKAFYEAKAAEMQAKSK